MTSSTGFNESAAQSAAEVITSGGVTIHLCTTTLNYSDGATAVSSASASSANVAEADLTITTPSGFAGTTTIENDNEVAFGTVDAGTIVEIVIQNQNTGDIFVLADEPNDPDTTGEDVNLPANTTLYELGNP